MGVIIGNTGAEVLTTMLSWVQGELTGMCSAALCCQQNSCLHACMAAWHGGASQARYLLLHTLQLSSIIPTPPHPPIHPPAFPACRLHDV